MKKLLCMILALIMVMSLCACGEGTSDNGQNNSSVNAGADLGTNEDVDPNIEAVKAVLVGTWLPDGYGENQETAELLKFNEDGTVEMLGTTYTWEIKFAGKDSARIGLYDGETYFCNAEYSVRDGVRNYLSLEHVRGSGDKYMLEHSGYHREADYQIIEITLDNYKDYFEMKEFAFVSEDSFGDATKIRIYHGLVFKEEYGKVNYTISQGAFEYSYHSQSQYEVTADKTTAEYTYGEKVKDGNPNTDISDCQKQGNLEDGYGIICAYSHIDSFPSDKISLNDEITVTRAIGKLFIYTHAE